MATDRRTGDLTWLFNIKADTRSAAIGRGKSFFRTFPQGSPIPAMYSIRETSALPLSKEDAELLGWYDNAGK